MSLTQTKYYITWYRRLFSKISENIVAGLEFPKPRKRRLISFNSFMSEVFLQRFDLFIFSTQKPLWKLDIYLRHTRSNTDIRQVYLRHTISNTDIRQVSFRGWKVAVGKSLRHCHTDIISEVFLSFTFHAFAAYSVSRVINFQGTATGKDVSEAKHTLFIAGWKCEVFEEIIRCYITVDVVVLHSV